MTAGGHVSVGPRNSNGKWFFSHVSYPLHGSKSCRRHLCHFSSNLITKVSGIIINQNGTMHVGHPPKDLGLLEVNANIWFAAKPMKRSITAYELLRCY
jgi:hypothetical protein